MITSSAQYIPISSFSKIGECPLYLSFKALRSGNPELAISGTICGWIALPLSLPFTPIAIVADMVIGIVESIFVALSGYDLKTALDLAIKKLVISPIQQIIVLITRIALFILIPPIWSLSYEASIGIIKILPDSINHKRFDIFIDSSITERAPLHPL